MLATDLARLFTGLTLLTFASYTDWRWRRAPNVLWLVMAGIGLALLGVDAALDFASVRAQWPYLVVAPAFAGLMYAFWWFGLIAGGADAKALMAMALLAPFPLALAENLPLSKSPSPAAFVVLGDALLVALLVPVTMFLANAARGRFHLPMMFLGYERKLADLDRGHAWPMEYVDEDGRVKRVLFASRRDLDLAEQKDLLAKAGRTKVWVTPKVPFMIPLLVAWAMAFTLGDLLYALVARFS